jgi:hypothetical protein
MNVSSVHIFCNCNQAANNPCQSEEMLEKKVRERGCPEANCVEREQKEVARKKQVEQEEERATRKEDVSTYAVRRQI